MPPRRVKADRLFRTGWVHVFEEDVPEGSVYRPEADAIPLSRRPRERLSLDESGTARVFAPGPDDRLVELPATWEEEAGVVVVRARDGGPQLRIVSRSPNRLVVHVTRGRPGRPA